MSPVKLADVARIDETNLTGAKLVPPVCEADEVMTHVAFRSQCTRRSRARCDVQEKVREDVEMVTFSNEAHQKRPCRLPDAVPHLDTSRRAAAGGHLPRVHKVA